MWHTGISVATGVLVSFIQITVGGPLHIVASFPGGRTIPGTEAQVETCSPYMLTANPSADANQPHAGSSRVGGTPSLTPAQRQVLNELLAIGDPRPTGPAGLAEELSRYLADATRPVLAKWTERSLWLGKSLIGTALRCEGQLAADAALPRDRRLPVPTAIGVVVHRAIQLTHTHPGRTCDEYIRAAIQGSRTEDSFEQFWLAAEDHVQSDLIVSATSRLVAYIDSMPPLDKSWTPRFEEPISAKIGSLVLAARPDLVLGRPRPDGRQTLFMCDMKSTDIRETHFDEAMFYALVATLRYGCLPYRSCVLSLTTMEWTDPDVTAERMWAAAGRVVDAATRVVDVMTETRGAELLPGRHCTWCAAKPSCPAQEAWARAGSPNDPVPYAIAAAPVTVPSVAPVELVSAPAARGGDDHDPYAI